jgi:hypothetical protein
MRNVVGVEREVISGAPEHLLGYPKYFCALSHVHILTLEYDMSQTIVLATPEVRHSFAFCFRHLHSFTFCFSGRWHSSIESSGQEDTAKIHPRGLGKT